MRTRSVLDLVDRAVPSRASGGDDPALRAQAAFVRALIDEVHRNSDQHVAALHEQLGDELTLLAQLIQRGAAEVPAEAEIAASKPIDVLVVDDDDESRQAAAAALRALGYPCRAVADADEALREHDREPAAIVLSDGLDPCAALKLREPQPYVILASAFRENARALDLDELEARLLAASRFIRAVRLVAALDA